MITMPKAKQPTTVKEIRESLKLSQAEFAKALNISVASVSAYETGRSKPGAKTLEAIKELYGVELPASKPEKAKKAAPQKKQSGKPGKKAAAGPVIVIQSPLGGNITPAEIAAKVGQADTVYVRVDENKAYWVRGEETGSVDLL